MITLRVWFLITTTTLLLSVGIWTSLANQPGQQRVDGRNVSDAHHQTAASPAVTTRTATGADATGRVSSLGFDSEALQELLESAEPHLDVYGNEIEDAVSDYRIDPAGDVYERHSPETEVPRLAPPVI